jgi:hypothetical protein
MREPTAGIQKRHTFCCLRLLHNNRPTSAAIAHLRAMPVGNQDIFQGVSTLKLRRDLPRSHPPPERRRGWPERVPASLRVVPMFGLGSAGSDQRARRTLSVTARPSSPRGAAPAEACAPVASPPSRPPASCPSRRWRRLRPRAQGSSPPSAHRSCPWPR